MRTLFPFPLPALVVVLLASPVIAQSAPVKKEEKEAADPAAQEREEIRRAIEARAEALRRAQKERDEELRRVEDKLRQAEKEREENLRRAKEAVEATQKKVREKVADLPPLPPVPMKVAEQRHADHAAAVKQLTQSGDPKVAALAKQLLEALSKSGPQPMTARIAPGSGRIEVEFTKPPVSAPVKLADPVKVVVADKVQKTAPTYSSLRMSADGKTAAVIAADGSVTVFDTASGKEMMSFPAKK